MTRRRCNRSEPDPVPRVAVVFETHEDGSQSVFVSGQRPNGQWVFGSFFQPTLNHPNHNNDDGDGGEEVGW